MQALPQSWASSNTEIIFQIAIVWAQACQGNSVSPEADVKLVRGKLQFGRQIKLEFGSEE
jgi:hypothetical protein